MKEFSNKYTFIFATLLAVVVAVLLTLAALQLQPFQERNIEIEKKRYILASLNIGSTVDNATELYQKFIVDVFTVDGAGTKKRNADGFSINLKDELSKPASLRNLPVFCGYIGTNDTCFVFPLIGKGLWGPIYGYVALRKDMNTIYGITFDHKGETPGLGAEITKNYFKQPFRGKVIFDDQMVFNPVAVIKKGKAYNSQNRVDAVSGATITSAGVQKMIYDCLLNYKAYLIKNKK